MAGINKPLKPFSIDLYRCVTVGDVTGSLLPANFVRLPGDLPKTKPIMNIEQPLAIGVADLARHISLSPITIRQYIRQGKIDSIKIGRRRLILSAEVDRLIRAAQIEQTRANHARINREAAAQNPFHYEDTNE